MSLKRSLYCPYVHLWLLLLPFHLAAQQPRNWKKLRQEGANFYEIQDTFERQNAALLQAFRNAPPQHEGDDEGQFNRIIKYNRWANRVKARVAESQGELSALTIGNARALAQQATELQGRTGESWQLVSPPVTPTNGGNGRVNAVRVHPTNPNILFACTPAGGLWKSINGGTSWVGASENIAILGCSDIGFSPTNPNIMYLATGDGEWSDSYSTGVYKSTDGGLNWLPTGLTLTVGQKEVLSRVLVHPTDGSILVTGSGGIRRSTDEGATWTLVSSLNTRDMEFKPDNPAIVYATQYDPTGSCFLRSTNGGATWTTITTGLPISGIIRAAIGVTPADANYVYLMVSDNLNYGLMGIYRSTDAGLTFARVGPSSPLNTMGWEATGSDSGGQGLYDIAIAVSPTNRDLLFTGGVNIWKSTNGGATFTIAAHWEGGSLPYVHADIHDLVYHGTDLWVGCDGGVFKTTNQGSSWTDKSANLSIAQIYGFGQSATNPNLIVSGHQDNGTNLMTSATQWSQVVGGDGMKCFIDRTNDNNIFASVYYGYFFRSTNRGASFTQLGTLPTGSWVTPWLQDPINANTLYAGGTEVYKSSNSGNSWNALSNFGDNDPISALDVSRSNNQMILAAKGSFAVGRRTYTPHIYKSLNGGTTWTEITGANFPTNASIIGAHIDENNSNRIYIGFASYTGNSVYISNNGGSTWTNYSAGLPSIPANCFVTTSGHADGEVFVGTDLGVYRRTNSSSAWETFNHNLPSASVSEMHIFYPTSQLRISTFGRGIWQTALPGHNSQPVVRLTAPTTGQIFNRPANINLAATATDADGRIVRVEFYEGNNLLATDTSAPYTTTWSNVRAGNYELTAKAIDDSAYVSTSYPVAIAVLGLHDAQLSAILEPVRMVAADTASVLVRVKNVGSNPLTALTIHYQLDSQAIQTHSWVGSIASLADTVIQLSDVLRYAVGAHRFWVCTSNPNGMMDENLANDTLRESFTYELFGTCSNNYEPNNTPTTTTLIPTEVTIRSMLADRDDVDAFRFKTTLHRPAFKVVLNELPANFDLVVLRHNYITNQLNFMGESLRTGLLTDSLVFDNLVDTGTYYAVVFSDAALFSTTQCYALRVETRETARYDISVDSILTPRGDFFSNQFNASVLIRNRGTSNITYFEIEQRLGTNSSQWQTVSLPNPLLPDSTVLIPLNSITGYTMGSYSYRVVSSYPNRQIDRNRANDTAYSTFRYLLRPTVVLNTPSEGQIFAANATIPLTATATALNTGTSIAKVEFYNGATLLETDNTFPYAFTWTNVPIGSYSLTAKAYDNAHYTGLSSVTMIHVSGATDAGVTRLVNSDAFIGLDSVRPLVQVRNFGTDTLQQVTIHYQLDNEPVVNQSFINLNLATGVRANFTLPLVRYIIGIHRLKVWTTQPNLLTDMNPQNDTLHYEFKYEGFGDCADNYEPNNTLLQPTPIPTNVTVRSKLAVLGDRDYFMFKTTRQQPSFTAVLNELSNDHDLIVYKWNYATQTAIEIGWSFQNGLDSEVVRIDFSLDTGTYMAAVVYGAGVHECYALKILTHEPAIYDLGISHIQVPQSVIETATFTPKVQVRNTGNLPISSFYLSYRIDNNWAMSSNYNLSTPLQPNDTINLQLLEQSGYSTGMHQFYVSTQSPNSRMDMNTRNDTMIVPFRYVTPPIVQFSIPTQGQVYNGNVNLWATARAQNNNARIMRVEFYNGTVLMGVDTSAPYQHIWQNAPIGTYIMRAKAIDSDSLSAFTPQTTIHVTGNHDAGVVKIENIFDFTYQDSVQPVIRIRNYGARPLTKVAVHLQLDSQTVVNQSFSGIHLNGGFPLSQGDWTTVTFPMFRYALSSHTLTTWTSAPNDSLDINPANDTFRQTFESRDYGVCADNYEPNNDYSNATPIPTDRIVRSKLALLGDTDFFTFKTTPERPAFTAVLHELVNDHDLEIYRFDAPSNQYLYIGGSSRSGTQIDSVRYTMNSDSGTYIALVKWGAGVSACYALKINTHEIPPTISLISPRSGANYPYRSTIPLIARATGLTGNIVKVSFFANSILLHTDSIAPYEYSWNPTNSGNFSISAHAYDAQNWLLSQSPMAHITILPNNPPTVNWLTPNYGQTFPTNSAIPLSVQAADPDTSNRITKVEFYKDAQLLFTDSVAPYSYAWQNAPIGINHCNAKAYDNWGAVTMSNDMLIFVKARLDVVLLNINRPVDSVNADSALFQVRLRQLGLDTLRSLQIQYQLNQNPISTYVWTGILPSLQIEDIDLPTLRFTQLGLQTLKVWTTLPNQGLDENRANDTLRTTFQYLRTGVSTIFKNAFQFKLAPNPAHDKCTLYIQTSSSQNVDYQLVIKDVLGRTILQRNLAERDILEPISIETADWSKGIYFVSIQREGQMVTEKLVIE